MKRRIFTAIDISDEAREKVSVYIESLRRDFQDLRVGWEKSEKLHLTLKFFGDVYENELENVQKIAENTASQMSSFKLKISSNGVFPNLSKTKILWLGLEDESDCLKKTNEIFEKECEKFGFAKENRNFKPHLTIARLREPEKSKKLAEIHLQNEFPPIEFSAESLVIYESKLLSNGSIYRKLRSFNF